MFWALGRGEFVFWDLAGVVGLTVFNLFFLRGGGGGGGGGDATVHDGPGSIWEGRLCSVIMIPVGELVGDLGF